MSAKNSSLVLFTLTSARSGTLYLRNLFRNNVRDCLCRHEPFFDWGNPTMFGPAIYDAYAGRVDRIRERLLRKRDYVARRRARVYLESSHAFLKSAYVAALDVFPDLRLIHLIRDPLMVAKSEAVRERRRQLARVPFHYYRGDDGRRHFYWSLTGNEQIYKTFDPDRLSLFQKYLIQWIEIENRAIRFLDQHALHDRCFTLDSPRDLNHPSRFREMLDFFGLETIRPEIVPARRRNVSLGHKTVVRDDDVREARMILNGLPPGYLEIFRHEPYTRFEWHSRLFGGRLESSLQNVP